MRKHWLLTLVLCVGLALAVLGTLWMLPASRLDRAHFEALREGMTRPEVERLLGGPPRNECSAPAEVWVQRGDKRQSAGIEPGGPGAFSCARLPETITLLADNPELVQHLRDLCAQQGARDLPAVPARPARYFRPVP